MHSFEWDALHLVLRISRHGSLLAASKQLRISHSTLSRRLSSLEEKYGGAVFERHRRGLVPTELGNRIIETAETMELQAQSLERDVLGSDARLEGDLRVTTMASFARRHSDLFARFSRRHPRIDLELTCGDSTLDLGRREADVALRMSDHPPPHLVGRRIVHAEFALYASRALVGSQESLPPLDALPWLAWERRMGAHLTEAWMREHVPDARIACVLDDSLVMLEALRAGVGVGFCCCADGDPDPALVRLRPPESGFGMDLWALTHPDVRRAARVRCFLDFVYETLEGWTARYRGTSEDVGVEFMATRQVASEAPLG